MNKNRMGIFLEKFKSSFFMVLLTLLINCGYGQALSDTAQNGSHAYGVLDAKNLYDGIYTMMEGDHPISYLSFFPQFVGLNRPIPLSDGEGERGYILEGSVDQIFKVGRGRMGSGRFWQTSTVSIRYYPAIRLTKDADSKPALPSNQKIGLRIDKTLWDNKSWGASKKQLAVFKDSLFDLPRDKWLSSVYFTFHISHFSNGQRSGSYIDTAGSVPNVIRNDYKSGDFSTNFINASLTSNNLINNNLFSASLGYQYEFGASGVAEYTSYQENRYGYHRLLGMLQWRSSPFKISQRTFPYFNINTGTLGHYQRLMELRVRAEFEYILDPIEDLYLYDRGDDYYKLGAHLYIELNPFKWETIGLLGHFYYGRDYLNIRYDDPVIAGMAGISLTKKKYHPPFMSDELYLHPFAENKVITRYPGPEDAAFIRDGGVFTFVVATADRSEGKKNREGGFERIQFSFDPKYATTPMLDKSGADKYIPLGLKQIKNPLGNEKPYLLTNSMEKGTNQYQIVGFELDDNEVHYKETYSSDLGRWINNLNYDEDLGLFVSSFTKAKTAVGGVLRFLPKGYVLHADSLGGGFEKIAELKGANSFGFVGDKVYVTGTLEKKLYQLHKENGAWKSEALEEIPLKGGDNITVQDGVLYTTGTPSKCESIRHFLFGKNRVGSLVYEIDVSGDTAKYKRIILINKNMDMGMVSVVAKADHQYILGQTTLPYMLRFNEDDLVKLDEDDSPVTTGQSKRKNKYTRWLLRKYPDIEIWEVKNKAVVE